jgi:flagellar hook-associated protein 3 FlgL
MRVTDNMRFIYTSKALQDNASRTLELTQQVASGQKIAKPSDDPAVYASIVRRGDRMNRMESRRDAVARAASDLRVAEGALAGSTDLFARVRELAVQFADGFYSQSDRDAAVKEVASIRQQLVAFANTKGQRGFIFSGTATDQGAVLANGTFNANDETMDIEYADGQFTASNVDGRAAFTSKVSGTDPFFLLTQLETALGSMGSPAAVRATLPDIENVHNQFVQVRADTGLRINRLESAQEVTSNALTLSEKLQNEEKQGDFAELATKLSLAQSAYERSVAVTRQVLSVASAIERF